MAWQFKPQPVYLVETEVTQRDQFKNDEVDLSDTLVREAVQNSLDARRADSPVTVRFRYVKGENRPSPGFMQEVFEQHRSHAGKSGIDLTEIKWDVPSAIVIEDFGTTGLTGPCDVKDGSNFCDFWRRHGSSHKHGASRGRWGLGKLVFSSSSTLSAFFGLTVRDNDQAPLLMGQTVLRYHQIDGLDYPPHAFFSDIKQDDPQKGLQVPLRDEALIGRFVKEFSLTRQGEPGLSIVIPFPREGLALRDMIEVGIINYFIPILRGQLRLEFNDVVVDSESVHHLAHKHAHGKIRDADELFAFVTEADKASPSLTAKSNWFSKGAVTEAAFTDHELKSMREQFALGNLITVRFPFQYSFKSGETQSTEFLAHLKKPHTLSKGQDFYVRSGITLPAESKFGERRALGMLIAEDEPIAEFLGDAENAAHTRWNGKAEKLQNYRNAEQRLRAVRNSLLNLYDLLTLTLEEQDERALIRFFWTLGPAGLTGKKAGTSPPNVPNIPKPSSRWISINGFPGGFTVAPGAVIPNDQLPIPLKLMVAFDVVQGNPFKLWSEYDFDFAKNGDATIEHNDDIQDIAASRNEISFLISGPDFRLNVSGLDTNRDLIVSAESQE